MSYSAPKPLVHGHRGCRGLRPENTLPAFEYALRLGVDVLELDVVLSADGQVVVSHEPWFSPAICLTPLGQRIPVGQEQAHNLFRLSYAEIRRYDCGQLQHPNFPEQVAQPAYKPLLTEVLALAESLCLQLGPVRYSIEVKSEPHWDGVFHPAPAAYLPVVLRELQAAGVLERSTLLSFDARILRFARQLLPELRTCLLIETPEAWPAAIQHLGFVPSVLGPDFTYVTPEALAELRVLHHGVEIVPWTVNEPADMAMLLSYGVDGITTDYPNRLLALLGRSG